jgi:hypothetical protein
MPAVLQRRVNGDVGLGRKRFHLGSLRVGFFWLLALLQLVRRLTFHKVVHLISLISICGGARGRIKTSTVSTLGGDFV